MLPWFASRETHLLRPTPRSVTQHVGKTLGSVSRAVDIYVTLLANAWLDICRYKLRRGYADAPSFVRQYAYSRG